MAAPVDPPAPAGRPAPDQRRPVAAERSELGDLLAGASTRGWTLFGMTVRGILLKRSVIVALVLVCLPLIAAGYWASDPMQFNRHDALIDVPGGALTFSAELPDEVIDTEVWTIPVTAANGLSRPAVGNLSLVALPSVQLARSPLSLKPGETSTINLTVPAGRLSLGDGTVIEVTFQYVAADDPQQKGRPPHFGDGPPISTSGPGTITIRHPVDATVNVEGSANVTALAVYPSVVPAGLPVTGVVEVRNGDTVPHTVAVSVFLDGVERRSNSSAVPAGDSRPILPWTYAASSDKGGVYSRLRVQLTVDNVSAATTTVIFRGSSGSSAVRWTGGEQTVVRASVTVIDAVQAGHAVTLQGRVRNAGSLPETVNITIAGAGFSRALPPLIVPAGKSVPFGLTVPVVQEGENAYDINVTRRETTFGTGIRIVGTIDPPATYLAKTTFLQIAGIVYLGFVVPFAAMVYAGNNIAGEIERRTMSLLALRPLRRSEIILYKYLGYVAAVTALTFIPMIALYAILGSVMGSDQAGANAYLLLAGLFSTFVAILAFGAIFTLLAILPKGTLMAATFYLIIWELPSGNGFCGIGQGATLIYYVKSTFFRIIASPPGDVAPIASITALAGTYASFEVAIGVVIGVVAVFLGLALYLFRSRDLR